MDAQGKSPEAVGVAVVSLGVEPCIARRRRQFLYAVEIFAGLLVDRNAHQLVFEFPLYVPG